MDADLLDWDTHFVPGLLGPLLTDPTVAAGQGLLRAARRSDGRARGRPGHRAGRAAADRAAVPRAGRAGAAARRGVGGAAVAVRDAVGARPGTPSSWPRWSTPPPRSAPDAIAQVDLGRRAHRHQSLRDLGAMAAQILAAAGRRRDRPPGRADHGADEDACVHAASVRATAGIEPCDRDVPTRRSGPPARVRSDAASSGRHEFADDATLMMAIVNRTPDSFYDKGATWAEDKAFDRVAQVVEQGPRSSTSAASRPLPAPRSTPPRRCAGSVDFVARVRAAYPDLVISVDTWRAEVGRAVCEAGADVLNDAWGGADPELVDVAAEHGAALVCTHTGGVSAAHPPAPDRVRRRGGRRDRRHRRLRRAGRRGRRRPDAASSSTRRTTSARTPSTPSS